MLKKRQEAILSFLGDKGIDGMVLNAGPSLVYFSGLHFHLSERPVVFFLVAGKKTADHTSCAGRTKTRGVGLRG